MASKLHAVREACKLEPEERTAEHINDIMEFVKDVKFFTKLTNLQQRALCRTMTHEVFGPREFIFQKGDVGDKFYIILTGSVSVQVPSSTHCPNGIHTERCDCPNRPMDTVVFLEKGMGFGELALQSDQLRSATIMTGEKTETLVTKRADYEQYAGQLHRQFIEQRVKFLRQFPRIEDALQRCLVSTQDIAAMANCLNEASLSGNEMAVRQGDVVDNMIFVRKGQLAMLRLVDLDCPREADGTPCAIPPPMAEKPVGGPRRPPGAATRSATKEDVALAEVPVVKERGRQAAQLMTTNFGKMLTDQKNKSRQLNQLGKKTWTRSKEGARDAVRAAASAGAAPVGQKSRGNTRLPLESMPAKNPRGEELWKRLRTAMRQAMLLCGLQSGGKITRADDADAGKLHVAQFLDVSAARRKFAEYRSKELTQQQQRKRNMPPRKRRGLRGSMAEERAAEEEIAAKAALQGGSGDEDINGNKAPWSLPPNRRKLLRIGTIGAFQYFGDRQVCNGDYYPVSLVSDPVAEIYLMSKHDIQRRLPKKLFSALFTPDKEIVPSDLHILDMHRQAERWSVFRKSMHGEALSSRQQACNVPRPLRDPSSRSRVDAMANLEFLGVNPASVPEVLPPPQKRIAPLTAKDEEFFSQASASFLRKFDYLKRDPELRNALAKAGLANRHPAPDEEEPDPMSFKFEQHWSKLGKFSMGLDHQDEDEDPEGGDFASRQSAVAGSPGRRSLMQTGGRRGSIQGDPGSHRSSSGHLGSRRGSLSGAASSGLPLGNERVFAATQMGSTEMLPPLPSARSLHGQSANSASLAAAVAAAAASTGPESARNRRRTVAFSSNT